MVSLRSISVCIETTMPGSARGPGQWFLDFWRAIESDVASGAFGIRFLRCPTLSHIALPRRSEAAFIAIHELGKGANHFREQLKNYGFSVEEGLESGEPCVLVTHPLLRPTDLSFSKVRSIPLISVPSRSPRSRSSGAGEPEDEERSQGRCPGEGGGGCAAACPLVHTRFTHGGGVCRAVAVPWRSLLAWREGLHEPGRAAALEGPGCKSRHRRSRVSAGGGRGC